MKVVLLAGGKGTRLSEETSLRPKPMVTIGDVPILELIGDFGRANDLGQLLLYRRLF